MESFKKKMLHALSLTDAREMDSDGDGVISEGDFLEFMSVFFQKMNSTMSKEEWLEKYGTMVGFDTFDIDGNSLITAEELAQGKAHLEEFNKADTDQSGGLSREEWIAKFGNDDLFDRYDQDGSGTVDASEWVLAETAIRQFDGNAKFTREEWIAKFGDDSEFDLYDLNHDGTVEVEEYLQAKQAQKALNQADTNYDGKISREEWVAKFGDDSMFDAYDADNDGTISAAEFMKGETAARAFMEMDQNHDGRISREEWIAKFGDDSLFDLYDADGDGQVDPEEFVALEEARDRVRAAEKALETVVLGWKNRESQMRKGLSGPGATGFPSLDRAHPRVDIGSIGERMIDRVMQRDEVGSHRLGIQEEISMWRDVRRQKQYSKMPDPKLDLEAGYKAEVARMDSVIGEARQAVVDANEHFRKLAGDKSGHIREVPEISLGAGGWLER